MLTKFDVCIYSENRLRSINCGSYKFLRTSASRKVYTGQANTHPVLAAFLNLLKPAGYVMHHQV